MELNARLNDNKGRKYSYRLGIPEKSKETSISLLSPKWMKNLSIGIFLDGQRWFDKSSAINQQSRFRHLAGWKFECV